MAFSTGGYGINPWADNNLRLIVGWEFNWFGFRGRGEDLMRGGWKASEIRNHQCFSSQILLEHDENKVILVSGHMDDRHIRDQYRGYQESMHGCVMPVGLRHCTRDFRISLMGAPDIKTYALDLQDAHISSKEFSWRDLSPWRTEADTSKLILPDDPSVDDLLSRLVDLQSESRTDYYKKSLKEKHSMPMIKQTAQIIQLVA